MGNNGTVENAGAPENAGKQEQIVKTVIIEKETGSGKADREETKEKLLKAQLAAARIGTFFTAALFGCFLWLTVSLTSVIPKVEESLQKVNKVAEEADELIDTAGEMLAATTELEKELVITVGEANKVLPGLADASEDIAAISQSLIDEGLPQLYETLENLEGLKKLEDINTEELNSAIKSLHDVVEPLAKLFGH